ncbi:M15 family metallopeptidase [Arthrobacter sp. PO-11]|uniref:M15 family metallopeptidase n=2 Tax=Arthrobacter cavernae TaxID=2817681 RepID=A0A939KLG0_9MICC|nr:M15 family metallopeptidase [Arthrobacter cavernae]MBO1267223.1 M15 family metallopeptidase [Arthrobacter cavernae]
MTALAACAPEGPLPSPAAAAPATGSPAPTSVSTPTIAATTPTPDPGSATPSPASAEGSPAAPPPAPPSGALPARHSLGDPASPWVVVNKHRPLNPQRFAPADLVRPGVRLAVGGEAALLNSTTAAAAEKLFAAAASEGVTMALASGYRSFSTQTATYNGYVGSMGQASADTASARPGFSEHQTGWSFDISDGGGACSFQPCFAGQPAAVWAAGNAHKYGFVVRYPLQFHEITGYYYEPWHLRYIGVDAATDMHKRGISTLEEYFGLEAAPDYL